MNEGDDPARRRRATERRTWPVRKATLGDDPGDDLSAGTTPEQRLTMVWTLTLEAWALAGLPIPDYPRAQTPVAVLRRAPS